MLCSTSTNYKIRQETISHRRKPTHCPLLVHMLRLHCLLATYTLVSSLTTTSLIKPSPQRGKGEREGERREGRGIRGGHTSLRGSQDKAASTLHSSYLYIYSYRHPFYIYTKVITLVSTYTQKR